MLKYSGTMISSSPPTGTIFRVVNVSTKSLTLDLETVLPAYALMSAFLNTPGVMGTPFNYDALVYAIVVPYLNATNLKRVFWQAAGGLMRGTMNPKLLSAPTTYSTPVIITYPWTSSTHRSTPTIVQLFITKINHYYSYYPPRGTMEHLLRSPNWNPDGGRVNLKQVPMGRSTSDLNLNMQLDPTLTIEELYDSNYMEADANATTLSARPRFANTKFSLNIAYDLLAFTMKLPVPPFLSGFRIYLIVSYTSILFCIALDIKNQTFLPYIVQVGVHVDLSIISIPK